MPGGLREGADGRAGPLPIEAVLPESCAPRRADGLRFDGTAFVAEWLATCPGGLEGREIRIEGLERTVTDVLVRYELNSGRVESQRLTASTTAFVVPAPQGRIGVFATYSALGVDHILRGIDHLMFVFALILLVRDRRRLIEAVTAFTVAHSLSLAAAALGWIVVPAPPVEAVVALSIMFLAAELARPGGRGLRLTERFPWVVAFAFGLLHGLGFARALLEVGLPAGGGAAGAVRLQPRGGGGALLLIALVVTSGRCSGGSIRRRWHRRPGPAGAGSGRASYLMGSVAAVWFVGRVAALLTRAGVRRRSCARVRALQSVDIE